MVKGYVIQIFSKPVQKGELWAVSVVVQVLGIADNVTLYANSLEAARRIKVGLPVDLEYKVITC